MKKLLSIASICAAVLIAVGVAAPAAKAATVTATWTGQITNGLDYGNNFNGFAVGDAVTVQSVFNTVTNVATATLTINGTPFAFSLPSSSYGYNGFGALNLAEDDGAMFLHAGAYSAALPGTLLTAFDGDIDSGNGFGEFQIVPGYTTGNFDISHLTVAVSATPIPAALPLFVSALLGLGAVGWRRKANAAA